MITLLYETYFSLPPRDRQHAEWFVRPQLWDEIRRLKTMGGELLVLSMPDEGRYILMGLPVNLDESADWVELRATCQGTVPR